MGGSSNTVELGGELMAYDTENSCVTWSIKNREVEYPFLPSKLYKPE